MIGWTGIGDRSPTGIGIDFTGMPIPDTRAPGFAEECERQAASADAADRADSELGQLEEVTAADIAERLEALEAEQGE